MLIALLTVVTAIAVIASIACWTEHRAVRELREDCAAAWDSAHRWRKICDLVIHAKGEETEL
jgi:hypothetical protein